MLGACLVVLLALFYLDVYRRTGEWPHWNYYLDFVATYGNGYDMLPLPPLGPWWVVTLVFYFSFFTILGLWLGRVKNLPPHFNMIVLLTFCGILQFTYYFRRAHIQNLLHISMPAILLSVYWLYVVRVFKPMSMPVVLKRWGYGFIALLTAFFIQPTVDLCVAKLKFQPVSVSPMVGRLLSLPQQWHNADPYVVQAAGLMDKYSGKNRSLVYFLGKAGFEVSMYSGRTNRYPYNDVVQPTLSPLAMERILAFDPHLKVGEYIYSSTLAQENFEKKLFDGLAAKFNLELVEQTNGLLVYKVLGEKSAS